MDFSTDLKDSGTRATFETGSHRDSQEGKGRFDLLPAEAMFALARVMERGAIKYDARNWEKGQPFSRVLSSTLRHLFQWLMGKRDEDHLGAAFWGLAVLVTERDRVYDPDNPNHLPATLDDLPHKSGELPNPQADDLDVHPPSYLPVTASVKVGSRVQIW